MHLRRRGHPQHVPAAAHEGVHLRAAGGDTRLIEGHALVHQGLEVLIAVHLRSGAEMFGSAQSCTCVAFWNCLGSCIEQNRNSK